VARTIVYIDGFNLYYRALKGTPHKWLDIEAMSRAALPHTCVIERVNYYTAHVSGRLDAGAPRRQHSYLRAIATLPNVAIHYGNFLVTQKWAGLVQPPDFRPVTTLPPGATPHVAFVWKTEEKGSDVNLGVHLVRDGFRGAFDLAAVLTNDTDLVEPIRIVTQELGLPVYSSSRQKGDRQARRMGMTVSLPIIACEVLCLLCQVDTLVTRISSSTCSTDVSRSNRPSRQSTMRWADNDASTSSALIRTLVSTTSRKSHPALGVVSLRAAATASSISDSSSAGGMSANLPRDSVIV
jgi:hypothetical protein